MEFKVIRRSENRYALWSTRVSDMLFEGVTREELLEWYRRTDPNGIEEFEALIDAADERAAADGVTATYEEHPDFLGGG